MIFYIWQRKLLKWQIGKTYALSKHFNFKQKLKSSSEIHCVAPMINKTLCLTTCSWNMTQSGMNTTLSSSLCPGSVDFEQDELGRPKVYFILTFGMLSCLAVSVLRQAISAFLITFWEEASTAHGKACDI